MNQGRFDFRGTGLSCLWLFLWTWLLTFLTFGVFFPVGLFRSATMDFRTHFYRQTPISFSWHRLWVLLELAPDYGVDRYHARTLYALGFLSAQTMANQQPLLR